MTTVKVGQRWQYTHSKYGSFIVEITDATKKSGPVIQLVKGAIYSLGTNYNWALGCKDEWQYLEGQDK